MKRLKPLFLLLTLGFLATPLSAMAAKNKNSFTLPNSQGKNVTLGKPWSKATVLVFYRGSW